jgi:hypothetical protein
MNGPLLALLGLRLPLVGPVPVGVLTRATILLANQVVHLHVVGTIRNPYVQVETRRLLSDEAVRFFLLAAPFPGL